MEHDAMIHFFIGTKAQYIKTAPLLRYFDANGMLYRLIDSGQHAGLTPLLRKELGVREPDVFLRTGNDLKTIPGVLSWMVRYMATSLIQPDRIREEIFHGDRRGVCVVHGDTPSTMLSAVLARSAGLKIAHLEAGLRSFHYLHPFPEEMIRSTVMRMADLLFAPSDWAAANLMRMRLKGRVVNVEANTNVEALRYSMGSTRDEPVLPVEAPFVLASIHRVETLHHPRRLGQVIAVIRNGARRRRTLFVLHPATESILKKKGLFPPLLDAPNVILLPLLPHGVFLRCLEKADFVITDGGSVQEECAMLGRPCLLMRHRTERPDGIGRNVLLSAFDPEKINGFLERWQDYRYPPVDNAVRPTKRIAEVLLQLMESSSSARSQSARTDRRRSTRERP